MLQEDGVTVVMMRRRRRRMWEKRRNGRMVESTESLVGLGRHRAAVC